MLSFLSYLKGSSLGSSAIWTLPNLLSILRIGVVPVFIILLYSPGRMSSLFAAFLFVAVSLTDWLDGYVARRFDKHSRLGRFLDPLADKLLVTTCLIMLIPLGRVPAWMAALIIVREIAVTGLRGIALSEGVVIKTSRWGKYKALFQATAITALIIYYPFLGIDFALLGYALLWIALILTIWSGMVYFVRFFREVMM